MDEHEHTPLPEETTPPAPAPESAPESVPAPEHAPETAPPAAETPPARDPALSAHVARVLRQAEALRAICPDIDSCFQDQAFLRLTSPQVGLDLRTAYELTHRAATVDRPAESGIRGGAPATISTDPSTLSRADRAEIRRRVRAGDKTIRF